MPAKMERKLKAIAGKKDWSKERKDAFVYGTMRKTGWKPSREKKLSALLDQLIQFQEPKTPMGPFQGSMKPESKIDTVQFPRGLSPAAALRIPLPQLMAYLNQRNILQTVF